MIDDAISKMVEEDERKRSARKRSGLWNPSAFGQCYRRQYWNRQDKNPSDPFTNELLRTFKLGTWIHEKIQSLLKADIEVEVVARDCKGFADVVSNDCVYDIKTMNSMVFKHIKRKKDESEEEHKERVIDAKIDNFLQVAFYALQLSKKFCAVCFVNKDNMECVEIKVEASRFKNVLEEELDILNGYWGIQKEPPALPRLYKSKECQYCQFRSVCDNNKKGERK